MLLSIWLLTNVSQVDVIDVGASLPHVAQVQGLASLHSPATGGERLPFLVPANMSLPV